MLKNPTKNQWINPDWVVQATYSAGPVPESDPSKPDAPPDVRHVLNIELHNGASVRCAFLARPGEQPPDGLIQLASALGLADFAPAVS